MLIFVDRTRRGPDPWVEWKVGLFLLGAVLGLVGMALGRSWLVLTAIGVLLVGVALKFLPDRSDEPEEPGADG